MVGHYFEKRRALATGIVACGTGVGMFVGPTLSVTLVNCYQWQGALWVTSGIVFVWSSLPSIDGKGERATKLKVDGLEFIQKS